MSNGSFSVGTDLFLQITSNNLSLPLDVTLNLSASFNATGTPDSPFGQIDCLDSFLGTLGGGPSSREWSVSTLQHERHPTCRLCALPIRRPARISRSYFPVIASRQARFSISTWRTRTTFRSPLEVRQCLSHARWHYLGQR